MHFEVCTVTDDYNHAASRGIKHDPPENFPDLLRQFWTKISYFSDVLLRQFWTKISYFSDVDIYSSFVLVHLANIVTVRICYTEHRHSLILSLLAGRYGLREAD